MRYTPSPQLVTRTHYAAWISFDVLVTAVIAVTVVFSMIGINIVSFCGNANSKYTFNIDRKF